MMFIYVKLVDLLAVGGEVVTKVDCEDRVYHSIQYKGMVFSTSPGETLTKDTELAWACYTPEVSKLEVLVQEMVPFTAR